MTASILAEDKISRARAQLSLSHPFYGAHSLAMQLEETASIPTMATDFFRLLWNRKFVDTLTIEELKFVIVHEVLHRIFMHPFRLKGRIHLLANMAMDYAINPFIKEAGLTAPKDCLFDEKFFSITWEQVYQKLFREAEKRGEKGSRGAEEGAKGMKQQGWGECINPQKDGKDGKKEDMTETEARAAEIDAESMNRAMLQSAKLAGHVPGNLAELIEKMWEPDLDYDEIFWKIFTGSSPNGYSMRNPSKSALHNYGMFASGRNRRGAGIVGGGFDTSGSITTIEAQNVLGIINGMLQAVRPERFFLIQFDHAVQDVEWYEPHDDIPSITIHGRGGTSFKPQFDHIRDEGIAVDQYFIVTDGHGDFGEDPGFPVTWLMTTDVKAPWGKTIRFKVKGQ